MSVRIYQNRAAPGITIEEVSYREHTFTPLRSPSSPARPLPLNMADTANHLKCLLSRFPSSFFLQLFSFLHAPIIE